MHTMLKKRCLFASASIALLAVFALLPSANAASHSPLQAPIAFVAEKPESSERFATNGAASYAIDNAGRLWAWGDNKVGELGNNSTVDSSIPAQVQFPAALGHASIIRVTVSDSGSAYAIDSDGYLWAWGGNGHGQLGVGDGDLMDYSVPTRVRFPAELGGVSIVSVSTTHGGHIPGYSVNSVYAVDNLGHLWAWGENADGQIGDGSQTDRDTPVRVQFPAALGSATIANVAVGDDDSAFISVYAVDSLGRLWDWGDKEVGQLGNGLGGVDPLLLPNQVRFPSAAGKVSITMIATGSGLNGHFFALDRTGRLWSCGYNGNGALGDGSAANQSIPVRVRFPTAWWQRSVSIVRVVSTHNSYGASYAIDDAGHLWSWGGNRYGALGNGASAESDTPQRVQFPSALDGASIVSVKADGYSAYAVDSDGRLWAWGNNRYGQLGNGAVANSFNPPALVRFPVVPGGTSIIGVSPISYNADNTVGPYISAGGDDFASTHAIDGDGHIWTWGYNIKGRLGNGSNTIASSPVQIRLQHGTPERTQALVAKNGNSTPVRSVAKPQFAYVTNRGGISAYRINATTGALTEVPGSPFPDKSNPAFLTVNPSGTVAYVANNSDSVSAYRIDTTTGALTEVPGSPFKAGSQPYFIRINPSGTIAYVANWMPAYVTAYRIDLSTGALTPANDEWSSIQNLSAYLPTPNATVSPAGPFAYWVVNDGIETFRIDPANGSNHEITGIQIDNPYAHSIMLNPDGTLAYVTEEPPGQAGIVSAYHVNAATGALTPVTGNPVATGFNQPDPVAINPAGTFAFVASKGKKGIISAYRINAATGALTEIPGSPFATGDWPTCVTIVQP